jgi:hypothetical protein
VDSSKEVRMEIFRTTFDMESGNRLINYTDKLLFMGSCFAENMGEKLVASKFQTLQNPFGILYNPESILNSLEFLNSGKEFTEGDLFEDQGVWNSFSHHSRFSDTDKERYLKNINRQTTQGAFFLKQADFLIITLGTAWVYQYKKTGKIVSNCHKIPAREFERFRLPVSTIVERCQTVFSNLKIQNPNLKIILTVSPVRHLKDGVLENQVSKATLLLAVQELMVKLDNLSYFPSYEIMMDDLRDYRFYASDMVHPSEQAVDYIWEKFKNCWMDRTAIEVSQEVLKIRQAMQHRPFFPQSESHQLFIKNQLVNIQRMEEKYPEMDFGAEKDYFKIVLLG